MLRLHIECSFSLGLFFFSLPLCPPFIFNHPDTINCCNFLFVSTFAAGKHSLKRGKFYAIEKKIYHRTVKSLKTGRSCGKIDAGVFKQFRNLSGLSLGHNQLEIIYERQKMMLTRRNWIYIEKELAKSGGMAGAPDEHAEVSGKSGLELFCPPACCMQIFASYLKIMITDTTEMSYRTGICET